MPKVSVIITCYNYGRFLAEAVESVLVQTFSDWEIVIVDDGSSDNTAEISQKYVEAYSGKARYIRQENQGVAEARNTGIAASAGDLICCLDADDTLSSAYLEETASALDKDENIHIVYTSIMVFGAASGIAQNRKFNMRRMRKTSVIHSSALFRKKCWETVGGYKSDLIYEDWELWISMIENGFKAAYIPRPLLNVRRHGISRSISVSNKRSGGICAIKSLHPAFFAPWITRMLGEKAAVALFRFETPLHRLFEMGKNVLKRALPFFSRDAAMTRASRQRAE